MPKFPQGHKVKSEIDGVKENTDLLLASEAAFKEGFAAYTVLAKQTTRPPLPTKTLGKLFQFTARARLNINEMLEEFNYFETNFHSKIEWLKLMRDSLPGILDMPPTTIETLRKQSKGLDDEHMYKARRSAESLPSGLWDAINMLPDNEDHSDTRGNSDRLRLNININLNRANEGDNGVEERHRRHRSVNQILLPKQRGREVKMASEDDPKVHGYTQSTPNLEYELAKPNLFRNFSCVYGDKPVLKKLARRSKLPRPSGKQKFKRDEVRRAIKVGMQLCSSQKVFSKLKNLQDG